MRCCRPAAQRIPTAIQRINRRSIREKDAKTEVRDATEETAADEEGHTNGDDGVSSDDNGDGGGDIDFAVAKYLLVLMMMMMIVTVAMLLPMTMFMAMPTAITVMMKKEHATSLEQ